MMFFTAKEWAEARDCAAKLRKRYPCAFPRRPIPLKIGLLEDIIADGAFNAREARLGLSYHCGTASYRKAVAQRGSMRHDLTGQPVEPVSPEHAAHASTELKPTAADGGRFESPGVASGSTAHGPWF